MGRVSYQAMLQISSVKTTISLIIQKIKLNNAHSMRV